MQDMGIGAGLAAFGFWGFVAVVIVAGVLYGIREREMQHETLRRMLESGKPVEQAFMDGLLGGDKNLDRHLKAAGVIMLFAAPGLAVLGWFISRLSPPWLFPMLGVAALTAFIGIGLLVAANVVKRQK